MNSEKPLTNERIILTGTAVTKKITSYIQELGGQVKHYPLIQTTELQQKEDEQLLQRSMNFDWLIFTSQHAVEAFAAKMVRFDKQATAWSVRIAAVGDQTEQALVAAGFSVHFKPTRFSADTMVEEMNTVITTDEQCLFIRGSLAKNTLVDGLHCHVETWTIYETIESIKYAAAMLEAIQAKSNCTIVFASPSAVHVFERTIRPKIKWSQLHIAAIGHITEQALATAGAQQIITPTVYTMQAVIDEIVLRKDR